MKSRSYCLFGFIALIWIIEFINLWLGHRLCQWGIQPRTISGLIGIPLAPFLHNGILHVFLNTVPFLILGALVSIQGKVFFELSAFIILISGISIWTFGRSALHVGASGLIYGYFGFLVAYGWYSKNITSLIISVFTFIFYSGILWGLLPIVRSNISWEGHLFGFVAGIYGAKLQSSELSATGGTFPSSPPGGQPSKPTAQKQHKNRTKIFFLLI